MFLFRDQPGEGAGFRFMPEWLVGTVLLWTTAAGTIVAVTSLT